MWRRGWRKPPNLLADARDRAPSPVDSVGCAHTAAGRVGPLRRDPECLLQAGRSKLLLHRSRRAAEQQLTPVVVHALEGIGEDEEPVGVDARHPAEVENDLAV